MPFFATPSKLEGAIWLHLEGGDSQGDARRERAGAVYTASPYIGELPAGREPAAPASC
jgi:hypothetical protein